MRILPALMIATALLRAAEPPRPRITGIAHAAFFVSDIEQARLFYHDLLGYDESYDLKNSDGTLSLTFIRINDRQYVELFPEREKGSDRLNHISIETDDAEAMRAYLAAQGVAVPAKVTPNRIGNLGFNVKDPDGHTVEITQYTPGGLTVKTKGKFMSERRISDRMAHFGILVGALEPAMKFYGGILGFQETWRGGGDPKRLSWVNMRVPDGEDYIEFMLYDQLAEPSKRGTAHHICLFVPNIEASKAVLETRIGAAHYERPLQIRTGVNRKRQMNLYDADGTRVELMEPRTIDGKPTPPSTAPPPH